MRAGRAPVIEHGTRNTYMRHGCRCEACKAAAAAYRAEAAQRARHGTRTRYGAGCRCEDCREAEAAFKRRYRTTTAARHGTVTRYWGGCRCSRCSRAKSRAMRRSWRQKKAAQRRLAAEAVRQRSGGRKGAPRQPHPFDLEPLLATMCCSSITAAALRLHVHPKAIYRARVEGLTVRLADQWAVTAGFHPDEVWGAAWWEEAVAG